jgi:hypothetical protein
MATALAIDPAPAARGSAVADVQSAIAGGRPATGFRHPHQIVTDIWVRREAAAWRAPAAPDRR